MRLIILFVSLTSACIFGIGSMLMMGADVVTSERVDDIFFGIIVAGFALSFTYDIYSIYQENRKIS